MEKSTYIYIGILSLLFIGAGSAGSTESGLAFFAGEFVGMFFLLYICVLIYSKVKEKVKNRKTL